MLTALASHARHALLVSLLLLRAQQQPTPSANPAVHVPAGLTGLDNVTVLRIRSVQLAQHVHRLNTYRAHAQLFLIPSAARALPALLLNLFLKLVQPTATRFARRVLPAQRINTSAQLVPPRQIHNVPRVLCVHRISTLSHIAMAIRTHSAEAAVRTVYRAAVLERAAPHAVAAPSCLLAPVLQHAQTEPMHQDLYAYRAIQAVASAAALQPISAWRALGYGRTVPHFTNALSHAVRHRILSSMEWEFSVSAAAATVELHAMILLRHLV